MIDTLLQTTGLAWWMWLLFLWTIPWKAIALWKSARQRSIAWFIVLFIVNTAAILEILYIFVFSRTKSGVKTGVKGKTSAKGINRKSVVKNR
jgi:hypothetical protein